MYFSKETKKQLIEKRELLIKENIGVWDKPQIYFKELEEIEQELMKREGII